MSIRAFVTGLMILPAAAWAGPGLHFEPSGAGYSGSAPGYVLAVTRQGAEVHLAGGAKVELRFAGSSAGARVTGEGRLPGVTHYVAPGFPERSRTGVPNFARAAIRGLYRGIDAVFYGDGDNAEFDLVVEPGARPESIAMDVTGATGLRRTRGGDLEMEAGGRLVRLRKPTVYQVRAGDQEKVEAGWLEPQGGRVQVRVGRYDARLPLVIDPVVEVGTYMGGTSIDQGAAAAFDWQGNAVWVGVSTSPTFPAPTSAARPAGASGYIVRMSPDLKTLLSTTFIANTSSVLGVAVDGAGAIYVCGVATAAFAAAGGGYASPGRGGNDIFVAKLDREGKQVTWASVLGGSGNDSLRRIVVNKAGETFAVGTTSSANFPTTAGAFQTVSKAGLDEGVILKLNANGGLAWSTLLGGSGRDEVNAIALDSKGNPVVSGLTDSKEFPSTPGAFQTAGLSTRNNNFGVILNAFVTKLKADGSGLLWSTFLIGTGYEMAYGVAVDAADAVYVCGASGSKDFPTTPGAFKTQSGGSQVAFISKLKPGGDGLMYSTYLGGTGEALDLGYDIGVNSLGQAYVAGQIGPSTAGQPPVPAGAAIAFVAEVNASGSAIDVTALATGRSAAIGLALRELPATGPLMVGGRGATDPMQVILAAGFIQAATLALNIGYLATKPGTSDSAFGTRLRKRRGPSLGMKLTCLPSPAKSGDTVRLALEVTNAGESVATNAIAAVSLGQSASVDQKSVTAGMGAQVEAEADRVLFRIPALAPGATFSASIPLPSWQPGSYTGRVESAADGVGAADGPGCTYVVEGVPKVEVTKRTVPPGPHVDGQPIEFVIDVENRGTADAEEVRVNDLLDGRLMELDGAPSSSSGDPCTVEPGVEVGDVSGARVTCTPKGGKLRRGWGVTYRIPVKIKTPKDVVGEYPLNTVAVTWKGGEGREVAYGRIPAQQVKVAAGEPVREDGGYKLGYTFTNGGGSMTSGLRYDFSTSNLKADYAAPEGCEVKKDTVAIPEVGRYLEEFRLPGNLFGLSLGLEGTHVVCPLPDLAPGESVTKEVRVAYELPGAQNWSMQVLQEDGQPAGGPVTRTVADDPFTIDLFDPDSKLRKCFSILFDWGDTPVAAGLQSGDSSVRLSRFDLATGWGSWDRLVAPREVSLFRGMWAPPSADGMGNYLLLGNDRVIGVGGWPGADGAMMTTPTGPGRNMGFGLFQSMGGGADVGVLQLGKEPLGAGGIYMHELGQNLGLKPRRDTNGNPVKLTTGLFPVGLANGDWDGDGAQDAMAVNFLGNSASMFWGNMAGVEVGLELPLGTAPTGVAAGDLNGDGRPELVFTHLLDNSPRVMNFGMDRQPTTWMLPPLPGGAVSPVIADLDGDGAGDLAMALPFENKIAVLQGVGDGTFREPKYYWIGQKPYWLGAGTRSGRPVLLGASAEGAGLQGVVMDFHGPLWTAPQGKATEKPRK